MHESNKVQNTNRMRTLLASLLLITALTLLGSGAALWLGTLRETTNLTRFQLDNEEAALLYQSMRLHSGESIYQTPDYALNAVPNVYPPMFFLMTAPFSSEVPSFTAGRTISACCFIILLILVFIATNTKLFRQISFSNIATSLVATGLISLTYELTRWSFFYRVDMLAVTFSVAGLVVLTTGLNRNNTPSTMRMACSLLLLTLGVYTKQTMLAAPLTACILLFLRDRHTAIRFLGAFVTLNLLIFTILCALTNGSYFRLTILANNNQFVLHDVVIWLRHLWFFYHYWIIAGALLLIITIIFLKKRLCNPWSIYFLSSLPGLFAIGKLGSAENYLIEPIVAFALWTAFTLKALISSRRTQYLLLLPIALFMLYAATQASLLGRHIKPLLMPSADGLQQWNELATTIRQATNKGKITWCEPAMLNLLSGQPIYYQPFIMSELSRQKQFSSQAFVNALKLQRFNIVVTLCDINKTPDRVNYLDDTIKAIDQNYTLERTIGSPETVIGPLKKMYIYRANR